MANAEAIESIIAPARAALAFEKQNWVNNTSVTNDPFYTPPSITPPTQPGTLLKTDEQIDSSKYLLPPGTALTRILYVSRTLSGTLVPVSAFILWPYTPKRHASGRAPIIAWAHGTSGLDGDGAPSHHKNLWQHFLAPYQLALNGYVVVASDYAGLGVTRTAEGEGIEHEYIAAPAHANDVVYAVQAARAAFPELLAEEFVMIGHSQGGAAAWGVAQRQAVEPLEVCLGCVAVSPVTRIVDEPEPFRSIIFTAMCRGLKKNIPECDLAEILTGEGLQRYEVVNTLNAGVASGVTMLQGVELLQPHWTENQHVKLYQELIENGGKALGCPLLIVHGEADPRVSAATARAAVERTRAAFPASQIDMAILPGISHTPALTAGQRLWMEWIADRFESKPVSGQQSFLQRATNDVSNKLLDSGKITVIKPIKPVKRYEGEQNWYLEPATEFYHAP